MDNLIDLPIFQNSEEDVHCAQAALQMVLKYHFPDREYGLEYLDRMTHHPPGGWTWDSAVFHFLIGTGFEVCVQTTFDYLRFAIEGEAYLRTIWSKEELELQKVNSDIEFEQQLALDLWGHPKPQLIWTKQPSNAKAVRSYFDSQYLVIASVNPYVLDSDEGYGGHWIVVTGYNNTHLAFNDSDEPVEKNRTELWSLFEKAQTPLSTLFAVKLLP